LRHTDSDKPKKICLVIQPLSMVIRLPSHVVTFAGIHVMTVTDGANDLQIEYLLPTDVWGRVYPWAVQPGKTPQVINFLFDLLLSMTVCNPDHVYLIDCLVD